MALPPNPLIPSISPNLSPPLPPALYYPHCPRAGRDRERTVCGDRIGWRMSRPPCRSSGRPDAIPKGGRGPPVVSRPLSGGQGPSSPHGEPGCLRRNVRGFGSVDLDCGDKPPPSGGRSERSAGGQALRLRGSPRGPPERGGKFRSRRRGPTSQHCGLPAMRPGPRRRSSSLVFTRSLRVVGRMVLPEPSACATHLKLRRHRHDGYAPDDWNADCRARP